MTNQINPALTVGSRKVSHLGLSILRYSFVTSQGSLLQKIAILDESGAKLKIQTRRKKSGKEPGEDAFEIDGVEPPPPLEASALSALYRTLSMQALLPQQILGVPISNPSSERKEMLETSENKDSPEKKNLVLMGRHLSDMFPKSSESPDHLIQNQFPPGDYRCRKPDPHSPLIFSTQESRSESIPQLNSLELTRSSNLEYHQASISGMPGIQSSQYLPKSAAKIAIEKPNPIQASTINPQEKLTVTTLTNRTSLLTSEVGKMEQIQKNQPGELRSPEQKSSLISSIRGEETPILKTAVSFANPQSQHLPSIDKYFDAMTRDKANTAKELLPIGEESQPLSFLQPSNDSLEISKTEKQPFADSLAAQPNSIFAASKIIETHYTPKIQSQEKHVSMPFNANTARSQESQLSLFPSYSSHTAIQAGQIAPPSKNLTAATFLLRNALPSLLAGQLNAFLDKIIGLSKKIALEMLPNIPESTTPIGTLDSKRPSPLSDKKLTVENREIVPDETTVPDPEYVATVYSEPIIIENYTGVGRI